MIFIFHAPVCIMVPGCLLSSRSFGLKRSFCENGWDHRSTGSINQVLFVRLRSSFFLLPYFFFYFCLYPLAYHFSQKKVSKYHSYVDSRLSKQDGKKTNLNHISLKTITTKPTAHNSSQACSLSVLVPLCCHACTGFID